jgi:hypothetical protein
MYRKQNAPFLNSSLVPFRLELWKTKTDQSTRYADNRASGSGTGQGSYN